jgi:hypothetical protein
MYLSVKFPGQRNARRCKCDLGSMSKRRCLDRQGLRVLPQTIIWSTAGLMAPFALLTGLFFLRSQPIQRVCRELPLTGENNHDKGHCRMENRLVAYGKHAASVIICLFNFALASSILVSLARGSVGQTVELPPHRDSPLGIHRNPGLLYVGTQY